MKRLLALCVVVFSLITTSAAASTTNANVQVSPNPVAADQLFSVSGCGYAQGSQLWVRIVGSTGTAGIYTSVDGAGCFFLMSAEHFSGSYSVLVNYANRKGSKSSVATTTFVVL